MTELKVYDRGDGVFEEYDDTYDMTIHCESQEEQDEVLAMLNGKVGHWTREERPDAMPTFTVVWRCSVCGDTQSYGETKYCPNCGAKMESEE